MAYNREDRGDAPRRRTNVRRRKKVCVFCGENAQQIDYKDAATLKKYVSER